MKILIQILCMAAVVALAGCTTTPQKVLSIACERSYEYSTERCAKAVAETYEVFQKRAEELVTDPATPPDVKKTVQRTELATSKVMLELIGSTRLFVEIKSQLAAGQTTEARLAIANAQLEAWVQQALPKLNTLIAALGG